VFFSNSLRGSVAVDPTTDRVYVTSELANLVTVIADSGF
jgi:hypothetical protein